MCNFSKPQFPCPENGFNDTTHSLGLLSKLYDMMHVTTQHSIWHRASTQLMERLIITTITITTIIQDLCIRVVDSKIKQVGWGQNGEDLEYPVKKLHL